MTHSVDYYDGLWLSRAWSASGCISRLHSSEKLAERWAAAIDGALNPRIRGTVAPMPPPSSQHLRIRISQLAQTCLARSKKDGAGAFYSDPVRAYWLAMFRICMELLQSVTKRPNDRPMPGRFGMTPCRHCSKPISEIALLVALLRERDIELGITCGGCVVLAEDVPPSDDAEIPETPQRWRLPPSPPREPREILLGARTTPSERDAGIRAHKLTAARAMLAAPPETHVELDEPPPVDDEPIPDEPDESESERDEQLDREPDRGQPARSPDDEWIF